MEPNFIQDVERAISGEKEAFVRLMMSMEQTLYRVSRSILKTDHECLDAVQEAVLNAFHSIHTLREPRFFKTWLIRIVMNVCYRIAREQNKVILFSHPENSEAVNRFEAHVELQQALESLNEELRLLIQLHYFEGFTVREMAELLQVAEGTLKSRLVKARERLAKWYTASSTERSGITYEQ
ncbi:sigma-70 family RNA polymerase sigma factor [Brevibacillus reuszeri]|uniref:sigma-70 family RNA polymerase sigma factor n=1 Tax=Brevibacillus reuszeri TaxID=54915 RepID=UPI0028A2B890|nr:sigma-70 family RNA polymerase sigma factor [Brevibacillus reuszeri]